MRKIAELFELSRGGEQHNVRAMEGLRGFAVVLVFLTHYATLSAPWVTDGSALASVMRAGHAIGNSGVDLFFVLSGYLIYGSLLGRRQPYLRFLRRRVVRIYPAFSAVFLLYLALALLGAGPGKIPSGAAAALRYILTNFLLLPGLFAIEPLITVAWSLSYEMFFYLLLPPLVLACGRQPPQWRIALFLLLAAGYLAWCQAFGGHWRMLMFAAGVVLFDVMHHTRLPAPPAALAACLAATALALAPSALPGPARLLALLAGFYLLCHACLDGKAHWLSRTFRWTPLRWLGNMSYSYYLMHGLAMKACFLLLARTWPHTAYEGVFITGMVLPVFTMTLVPASVLFLLVERPLSLAPASGKPPATVSTGSSVGLGAADHMRKNR